MIVIGFERLAVPLQGISEGLICSICGNSWIFVSVLLGYFGWIFAWFVFVRKLNFTLGI